MKGCSLNTLLEIFTPLVNVVTRPLWLETVILDRSILLIIIRCASIYIALQTKNYTNILGIESIYWLHQH